MSAKDEGFLARWSRRKIQAKTVPSAPAEAPASEDARDAPVPGAAAPMPPAAPQPLPAVESLTADSDFAPFMGADIDPGLKGRALKTLFGDPALYPMDGLDVYIDDYTKPDPLPQGWLEKLNQFANLHGEPQPPPGEPGDAGAQAREPAAPRAADACPAPESAPACDPLDTSDARDAKPDAKNRAAI